MVLIIVCVILIWKFHFECTFIFHVPVLCQSMYGFRIFFVNESVQLESCSLLFTVVATCMFTGVTALWSLSKTLLS